MLNAQQTTALKILCFVHVACQSMPTDCGTSTPNVMLNDCA